MDLEITVRHTQLSEELEELIRNKVVRIEKFLRGTPRLELIIEKEHEKYRCEMIVHASRKGAHRVAHDLADELATCVDHVVEKMGRQLAKFNDRKKDHHRGEKGGTEQPPAETGSDEPSYEQIVQREIKGE